MAEVAVEHIEHVSLEVRLGRRLAPPAPDGRRGQVSREGQVDRDWVTWLPLLAERRAVPEGVDGDWVWVYTLAPGETVWTLAWSAGVESVAVPSIVTALDDADASRKRRVELEALEVRRSQLEASVMMTEERLRASKDDLAVTRAQMERAERELDKYRQWVDDQKKVAQDELENLRKSINGQKEAAVQELKEHAAMMKKMREDALNESSSISDVVTTMTKKVSAELGELAEGLVRSESAHAVSVATRATMVNNELNTLQEGFGDLLKLKAKALKQAEGQQDGVDMFFQSLAKEGPTLASKMGSGIMKIAEMVTKKKPSA